MGANAKLTRDTGTSFDFRSEAGASLNHNRITRNLGGYLWFKLRRFDCESFTSDMPVYSSVKQGLYYPDVVVACDTDFTVCDLIRVNLETGETTTRRGRALINPVIIAEVWSDGNNESEKRTKLKHYEQIPSLAEYLTIEQTEMKVTRYLKESESKWTTPEILTAEDKAVHIKTFGLTLPFVELYAKCDGIG